MKSYFDKLLLLFTDAHGFFTSVAKEKVYRPVLVFFLITYLIGTAVEFVASLPFAMSGLVSMVALVGESLLSVIFAIIIPFVGAAIVHLGVLLVGGKKGYFNTFKPVTYATTVALLYGVLLSLVVLISHFVSPVDYGAFESEKDIAFTDLPLFVIASTIVIGIVSFVHVLYTEVVGVARFQKLSRGRALFAVLLPIIVVVIIAIIVALLIASLFAALI